MIQGVRVGVELAQLELAATIAIEHFRAKFNTALGVQSQGLCLLPPR